MKLLMTTDNVGGVWTYALDLACALAPYDVEIILAIMGEPVSREQRRQLRQLADSDVHEAPFKLEWMPDPWDDLAQAGRWLLGIARKSRPDIVHLNSYTFGALPWDVPVVVAGHSCVLSWHAAVRGYPAGPEWNGYRTAVARGLQTSDLVIAPTAAMLTELQRYYGPLERAAVIHNGRNPARFRSRGKRPLALAAGRAWDEAKNIATLAAAAPQISWPVYVAGQRQHPGGRIVDLPGVKFLDQLSPAAMAAWLGRASIFAHPARYEPFGLSIVEAALSQCALVLGDIPSLRELWHDCAHFVPPDDTRVLADTLNMLIAQADVRRDFAARARERAESFSPEKMAESYLAAYEHLQTESVGITGR